MSRPARGESATPARNTRNKSATPLPGLATKQSHAYGAQGKTNLHTQVRASGSNFAEDFNTGRVTRSRAGSAQPSEEPEPTASPLKKAAIRRGAGRQSVREPVVEEEEEEDDDEPVVADGADDPARLTTALGHGLGYGPRAAAASGGARVFAVEEPSVWRVSFRAFPRWARLLVLSADGGRQIFLEWFHRLLVLLLVAGMVYAWLPLTGNADAQRFRIFWRIGEAAGLPGYAGPPHWALEMWYKTMEHNLTAEMLPDYNMPEIQWGVNMNVLSRLGASEIDQKDLRSVLGLQNETLQYLKSILPVTIVLDEDSEQRYQIPEPFWQALSQRMAQGGDEMAPLWDSFISANQRAIIALSQQSADTIVSEAAKKRQLVTSQTFAQVLEQHNLDLAEQYTQDFKNLWAANFDKVQEIAETAADKMVRKYTTNSMARQQLNVLAKAVDVTNTYNALRTYNWFTYGEGAIIDPHLTTATANVKTGSFLSKILGKSGPWSFSQNSPATVLLPWFDVTDCWCAASGENGKAQITMMLNGPIFPQKIWVEHMPSGGTRNIQNAPRTIEIFVDVDTAAEATRFGDLIYESWHMHPQSECSDAPTDHHVCIGKGTYDIHASNHVQAIEVWSDAKYIGLRSNSFTVRIVENWGGPRTCIYRLRLTGED